MSEDINRILDEWPYEPGTIQARIIQNTRGETKLQMRVDLGILQMDLDGRPDGQQPFGYASYFEYLKSLLEEYREENKTAFGFSLTSEECSALREEALQYYYRYLCFFQLEDFRRVERDTGRNLALFDFIREFAAEEDDRAALEVYRPYVLMVNAQSRARSSLSEGDHEKALEQIFLGIDRIRRVFASAGREHAAEESGEVTVLKQLADEIAQNIPPEPVQELRERMRRAAQREDFELAARLRDKIRVLQRSTSRIG